VPVFCGVNTTVNVVGVALTFNPVMGSEAILVPLSYNPRLKAGILTSPSFISATLA